MWEIEKIETTFRNSEDDTCLQTWTSYRIVNKDGILRIDKIFDTFEEAKEKCDYLNDYGRIN